jgi:effector-binding domain-containing protein
MTEVTVELTQTAAQPAAVVRGHVAPAGLPGFLGRAFADVARTLAEQDLEPAGPPFGRYRPTADGFDVEAGFPATGAVRTSERVLGTTLPGGTVATAVHRGSYETVGATYEALSVWLGRHGYVPADEAWESYLDEPGVPEPRTLVHVPCRLG